MMLQHIMALIFGSAEHALTSKHLMVCFTHQSKKSLMIMPWFM